jgi:hypothetical protein
VNAMASKTSIKATKVTKRAAAKRVDPGAAKPRKTSPKSRSRKVAKPALLAGGNPQIAKAYGDAPVQTYIAAMPSWKRDVGRGSKDQSPQCRSRAIGFQLRREGGHHGGLS